jgi:hypothetical protein
MVLQGVPWTDVVKNAPKVAAGAKKLWSAIANRKLPSPVAVSPIEQAALPPEARAIVTLQRQVAMLEDAAVDLHNQMLASSELIQALADQNTQLIRRIEVVRIRMLWLIVATAVLGVLAVSIAVLSLVR